MYNNGKNCQTSSPTFRQSLDKLWRARSAWRRRCRRPGCTPRQSGPLRRPWSAGAGRPSLFCMSTVYVRSMYCYITFMRLNKCSDRSMEVKPNAILGNYDSPTDRPSHRLVLLTKRWRRVILIWKQNIKFKYNLNAINKLNV